MTVPTFTKTGSKAASPAKLDKTVFDVEIKNHELIKQAYLAYLANGRENLAVSKSRGQVRGGGRKPWRQKGTGRARFGSSRNPIWRGGGVAFGPTGDENYSHQLNLKAKRQAIRQSLTQIASENRLLVIEDFVVKGGKTSELAKLLAKLGVNREALIVVEQPTTELSLASRNLPGVKLSKPTYLNVYDLINADNVVFSVKALDATTAWLNQGKTNK
jgi:large subunit ribosomal protein L4